MEGQPLTPERKIGDLLYYRYPYLNVLIATHPAAAIHEVSKVCQSLVSNNDMAGYVLLHLIRHGKENGMQLFIDPATTEVSAAAESGPLQQEIRSLKRRGSIFLTAEAGTDYSPLGILRLFGI